jgi:hypothetical protein
MAKLKKKKQYTSAPLETGKLQKHCENRGNTALTKRMRRQRIIKHRIVQFDEGSYLWSAYS